MSAKEVHAMRLGPGKHLKGRTLFDGVVKPEEVRGHCPFPPFAAFVDLVFDSLTTSMSPWYILSSQEWVCVATGMAFSQAWSLACPLC